MLSVIFKRLREIYQATDAVMRDRACDTMEHELEELEHIFALLVLGAFVGIPSPPIQITMEMMPAMEREFVLMLEKVTTAHDPLAQLFSVFSID